MRSVMPRNCVQTDKKVLNKGMWSNLRTFRSSSDIAMMYVVMVDVVNEEGNSGTVQVICSSVCRHEIENYDTHRYRKTVQKWTNPTRSFKMAGQGPVFVFICYAAAPYHWICDVSLVP